MTDAKTPEDLTDADLDTAAGGLKYKLENAFVKSWSTSGSANALPTEEVTLNYTEVEWTY